MAGQLTAGDVVKLKSGGPEMTIEQMDTFGADLPRAACVWFAATKREHSIFELTSLEKVR